jgi:nanoRNase/pAp phosphatase (c-di-AMP/oligoRNAs hydrolase)
VIFGIEFHHDGGGHLKAAGFAIDEESIPKIKPIVDEYLDKQIKTES